MWPLAIEIGPLYLSVFGMALAVAYIVATFFVFRVAKHDLTLTHEVIFDTVIVTMLGVLVGARIAYILTHQAEFASSFLFYFLFRERPGFLYSGGVLGGGLALFVFTRLRRLSFWRLVDLGTGGIIWGYLIGQIGSLLDGFSFGWPTRFPWGVPLFGSSLRYQPLPLYEILVSVCLLIFLHYQKKGKSLKSWPSGCLFLFAFTWLNFASGLLNFMRGVPPVLLGLNRFQLFSFSVAFIGAIIFYFRAGSIIKYRNAMVAIYTNFLQNTKRRLKRYLPKKRYEVSQ